MLLKTEQIFVKEELQLKLIGWVSDAGPNAKAARRRLQIEFPKLLVADCFAHQVMQLQSFGASLERNSLHANQFSYQTILQIQLIVADYIKNNPTQSTLLAKATDIINWMNSHSWHMLYKEQQTFSKFKQQVLTLILACITCWTSTVMSTKQLMSLKEPLESLVQKFWDELCKVRGKKLKAKAKAEKILGAISQASFWQSLSM
jgi:hypothetical protein